MWWQSLSQLKVIKKHRDVNRSHKNKKYAQLTRPRSTDLVKVSYSEQADAIVSVEKNQQHKFVKA